MSGIFRTVFLLSCMGAGVVTLLCLLKPFMAKKLPAAYQRGIWLAAAVIMLIPVWRFIPAQEVKNLSVADTAAIQQQGTMLPAFEEFKNSDTAPMEYREIEIDGSKSIRLYDLAACIWFGGMCVFLLTAFINYAVFLAKKRKNSVDLVHNAAFEKACRELKIKRNIRLRLSDDTDSPMLVGTFFPVVYIPCGDMDGEDLVFMHELNHYKRGDLVIKWLTLFVNAVHWFNPFAYLMAANVSEACEVACDMAVIKDLNEEDRKRYMETILKMVGRKG